MERFSVDLPIMKGRMMEYRQLRRNTAPARALLDPIPGGSAMKDRRGFTLIEIIIVITIVGILAIIATSNLQRWMSKTNARGFEREVFSEFQAARIMASSNGARYRLLIDFGNRTTSLQLRGGSSWSAVSRPQVRAPFGAGIASVTPSGGSAVTSGYYAFVFNPSGEVYGQPDTANDNTIAAIDNAAILLFGANHQDNASITLFGWTGKARMN
jgi:prepilin-type N-terminal cleavage/methylation domain-containing protein